MFLKCFGYTSSYKRKRPYPTVIQELCQEFSLTDLRKSTHNFDDQNCLIGKGLFGRIYKACLQHSGASASDYTVAVKRFHERHGAKLFMNEVELLCQLRHPYIISLIGFCNHKKEKLIVYEYMSNRSLDQHLHHGELTWKKRLEICIGAARGLHYLHAGLKRTIIHRYIKPRSILLDDNMEPKLSGFDLSVKGQRFMSKPKPIKVDRVTGTFGYIPTEYYKDYIITDKTDVYAFGVLLLQVLSGRKYLQMQVEGIFNVPVEETIDANIRGKIAVECWQVFIELTQRCVNLDPDERPTMGEVEVELEHALSLQEQADITNPSSDYTLFSKTIINHIILPPETNIEDSDIEEM